MKKLIFLILFVAVLGGGYVGASWFMGSKIDQFLQTHNKEMEEKLGSFLHLENREFKRGLLTSQEKVTYVVSIPGQKDDKIVIKANNNITHGPLVNFKPGLASVDSEVVSVELNGKEIPLASKKWVSIETFIDFTGGYDSEVNVPPFNYTSERGVEVKWQGLKGHVSASADYKKISSDFTTSGGEVIEKGKAALSISDVKYKGDSKRIAPDMEIYATKNSLEVAELSLRDETNPSKDIKAEGVVFTGNTDVQDEFLEANGQYLVQKLNMGGKSFDSLRYDLFANRIHLKTLDQFMKEYKALLVDSLKAGNAAEASGNFAALSEVFKKYFPEFLKYDPEVGISHLGISAAGKEIIIKLSLKIPGAVEADFQNPMLLLSKLLIVGSLEAPQAALITLMGSPDQTPEQAQAVKSMLDQQMAGAVQAGYVIQEGDVFKSNLEFKQGQLMVNGKPIPLPPMMGFPMPLSMQGQGMDSPPPLPVPPPSTDTVPTADEQAQPPVAPTQEPAVKDPEVVTPTPAPSTQTNDAQVKTSDPAAANPVAAPVVKKKRNLSNY